MKPPLDHQEQAALLARWLEEHPGSPAPEGLDPDVLETVYALRPDLAPAPSFSIDEILSGVTCGPFAAAQDAPEETRPAEDEIEGAGSEGTAGEGAFPDPALPGPAIVAPVVDLAARRPHRRAWLWPAAGALAAAAMALLVVTPFLKHGMPRIAGPAAEMTAAPSLDADLIAEIAEPPAPQEVAPSSAFQAPSATSAAAPADGPAGPPTGAVAPPATVGAGDTPRAGMQGGEGSSGAFDREKSLRATGTLEAEEPLGGWAGASTSRDQAFAPAAPTAPSPEQPAVSLPAGGQTTAPTRAPVSDLGSDEASGELEEQARLEGFGEPDDVTTVATGGARVRREESKKTEEDEDFDDRSAGRATSVRRDTTPAPKPSARPSGRQAEERSREAMPAEPEAPAPAQAAASAPDAGVDALRSQANPLDYRSDWYLRDPSLDAGTRAQIAAAYAKVQSAVVAADIAGAMAALGPLLASPHPAVVQDAAFRLATLQLQSGQLELAGATVRRGLTASGNPTVYRSRLLALQGSILEESGRPAEATESYREAVDDNETRP